MDEGDITKVEVVLKQIRAQVAKEHVRITQHAHSEMVEEDITIDEMLEAIATAQIFENYPSTGEELVACSMVLPERDAICT